MKSKMLTTRCVEINDRWQGTLTAGNIEAVVGVLRRILGGYFTISKCEHADSEFTTLEVHPNAYLNSQWCDECDTLIRIFVNGDRSAINFSAAGYSWDFSSAPAGAAPMDHDDFRHAYFKFDGDKVTITQRAPAGKGCKHIYCFAAQTKSGVPHED